jgi:hypothetical protein
VGPRAGVEDAENLAPTGIRFPDRPACSESLYRLRYPGPPQTVTYLYMYIHIYIILYLEVHSCTFHLILLGYLHIKVS